MTTLDNRKIITATKWSTIAEIGAKLIGPVSLIILARLLTPEAFGVVTTVTLVISFVEIFTDGGFQKYIIQHEFTNQKDQDDSICVAFWSNMSLSFILWGVISLFCEPIAKIVGNPGLGYVIAIACISLPLQALSSIQMSILKRALDFKTLFKIRLLGIATPVIVTIPLALWLRNYWALIIGTICLNAFNAIALTYYSNWRIRVYFSFTKLREMLSFTIWTILESISIWLTGYIDIFLIGCYLNEFYLGIYKTSMTTVGQITSLITAATTPILFSSLSRMQSNLSDFKELFFKFQRTVGLFIIPLGIGIFIFRDLITDILLGSQWKEAANFIGLWALTSAITIILSHYSSEVYRALGRPKLSVVAQILHIIVLCPAMFIAVHYSFETIYMTRSLVRLELVLVSLIILRYAAKISIKKMFSNIAHPVLASLIMGIIGYYLLGYNPSSIIWAVFSCVLCIISYFIIISLFKDDRELLKKVYKKLYIRHD